MCPPHCGDDGIDDRALLHWPAPDAGLSEAMLRGFAFATAIAAAVGLCFCLLGLSAQIASMRRRERIRLDLSTLRAAWWLAVAAALAPALTACLWARAVSVRFEPLRICAAWSAPDGWTRVTTILGAVGPLVLFLVQTRRAKHTLVRDVDGRGLDGYRAAPRSVPRFADEARAHRVVLRSFATRVGLASAVTLLLGGPSYSWGVPYTLALFELTGSALVVLAFHFPTRAALRQRLDRALRDESARTSTRRRLVAGRAASKAESVLRPGSS